MRTALFALTSLALAAQNFSSREEALGRSLLDEIRRAAIPAALPETEAFVQRLGGALADGAPLRFVVLHTLLSIDPMPLPGGTIVVPARLLTAVADEAEFSHALAHAIGHSVLRHGMRKPAGEVPLVFLGGWAGFHEDTRGPARHLPLALKDELRRADDEADTFAANLLARVDAAQPPAFAAARDEVRALAGQARKAPSLRR